MTYLSNETSVEAGRPVEVYRFTFGSTSYYYTSSVSDETLSAQDYVATAISRSEIKTGPKERNADFQVTMPTSDPVAQIFVGRLPGVRVRLTVRRYHRGDTPTPEVKLIFDGYVQSATFSKFMKETTLTARPTLAVSGQTIPPRTFQSSCNHDLYDPLTCKADDTDPAFRAASKSVTSQVGSLLTVADLGAYAAGWFQAGYVESIDTGDFRTVLDDDGAGGLTLLLPFPTAPTVVNVFAGCDHTTGAGGCPKFDNGNNYGGFYIVPKRNPFQTGIK